MSKTRFKFMYSIRNPGKTMELIVTIRGARKKKENHGRKASLLARLICSIGVQDPDHHVGRVLYKLMTQHLKISLYVCYIMCED
jgi:hypothetical protein